MKIRIISIGFGVIAIFGSCVQKKDDLRKILTADCYWDILDKGSTHPINSCYQFGKLGACNFYYYHFFNKRKTDSVYLFDDDDVLVPNKWKIASDSILIRANRYHIISFNFDSVVLTATGRDTMILLKNCKTFNSRSQIR